MSVRVPVYKNVCIAPGVSNSVVWLIGVPATGEGRLETYSIDLSNINAPTARFVANQTSPLHWSATSQRACFSYPGDSTNPNSPILMYQFSPMTYFTNVYPNGTVDSPINFPNVGMVSNKLFSHTGAVENLNWFTGMTNVTDIATNSAWTGLRINATSVVDSSRDFLISQYPTPNPLLSVGAYISASNTPAQGYHIVFDKNGGGAIYTASGSVAPILSDQDRVLTLANPQSVDMGGYALSVNAIPLTMASVAYILDQASDNSTAIYYIDPSQSPKLQRASVQGDSLPFVSDFAATTLNTQIVVYSATTVATFNTFDTVAKTWGGPGLMPSKPSPSLSGLSKLALTNDSSDPSKAPVDAIIGGAVVGLVPIALVAFLVIRHRRKSTNAAVASASAASAGAAPVVTTNYPGKGGDYEYPMQQNYQQQTQPQFIQPQYPQQQQQQFNPHHSYNPQYYAVDPNQQPQQSPVIFQSQSYEQKQQPAYNYTPPTIFQPQSVVGSNASYSQAIYTPTGSADTLQSPYDPTTRVHASTDAPSNPQYVPPTGSAATPQSPHDPATQFHTSTDAPSNPQYVPPLKAQSYIS
ncbi:hypothetical protein BC939DRAFT_479978 [Gamsiella multidivaricata]|uniref:uncharacterized protein n=1 Tax=Gamsiella multidivaricata TaxID=101098 RepID=UPI00221F0CFA|nr:uncharacterized protein BC939DRAFT_479978 [Gamsiella multidivaricata]KAG0351213.1 hypothetical protein BGZ54_003365 [Gamsiella multidivaricata]KAI7818922.1 hypothetical protein BC939DRAFT_479978 [Gamsiella multidivaricata]